MLRTSSRPKLPSLIPKDIACKLSAMWLHKQLSRYPLRRACKPTVQLFRCRCQQHTRYIAMSLTRMNTNQLDIWCTRSLWSCWRSIPEYTVNTKHRPEQLRSQQSKKNSLRCHLERYPRHTESRWMTLLPQQTLTHRTGTLMMTSLEKRLSSNQQDRACKSSGLAGQRKFQMGKRNNQRDRWCWQTFLQHTKCKLQQRSGNPSHKECNQCKQNSGLVHCRKLSSEVSLSVRSTGWGRMWGRLFDWRGG
jgi:hypothetical protein